MSISITPNLHSYTLRLSTTSTLVRKHPLNANSAPFTHPLTLEPPHSRPRSNRHPHSVAEINAQKVATSVFLRHGLVCRECYVAARWRLIVAIDSCWRQDVKTGEVEQFWASGSEERERFCGWRLLALGRLHCLLSCCSVCLSRLTVFVVAVAFAGHMHR